MTATRSIALTEAQRRALGVRLSRMESFVAEARALGARSAAELEHEIEELRVATDALPLQPGRRLQGILAELFVLAAEIGPRQLKAYGPLNEESAGFLESRSARLQALVSRLTHEYENAKRKRNRHAV